MGCKESNETNNKDTSQYDKELEQTKTGKDHSEQYCLYLKLWVRYQDFKMMTPLDQLSKKFKCKIAIIFLSINKTCVLGAQNETVLLSTYNICFG